MVQPKRWTVKIKFQFGVVFSAEAEQRLCEHREDAGLLGRHTTSEELITSTWNSLEARSRHSLLL